MVTHTQIEPQDLLRLRRHVNAHEIRLGAQVDPLRRLIRKHRERTEELLLRLRQVHAIQKAGGAGPIGHTPE
jgi:hypothetical protein